MKSTKSINNATFIAYCKICGNQVCVPKNFTHATINCYICGNEIEKNEWKSTKPD